MVKGYENQQLLIRYKKLKKSRAECSHLQSGRENGKRQFQAHTIETTNHEQSGEDDNDQVDTEDIYLRPQEHNTNGEGEEGHSGDGENSGDMERNKDSYSNSASGGSADSPSRLPHRKTKLKTNEGNIKAELFFSQSQSKFEKT